MALRNAPIVLLDEATAFADPESEAAIQNALSDILARKTTIVIAHRLASIAEADQILVMRKGFIVEQGKHAELLASNGFYSTLWNKQEQHKSWKISKI